MSERKVLNKYFPPDFDPSKIPRRKIARDAQQVVRLMAPCTMCCLTCGEFIYKGKKFNAKKETVQGEEYYGIKIFRFYIKCTRCSAEITFKTDPKNADYIIDNGATRNYEPWQEAIPNASADDEEPKEDEEDPMAMLEASQAASKRQMEEEDALADLRTRNARIARADVDSEAILAQQHANSALEAERARMEKEEEDEIVNQYFYKVAKPGTAASSSANVPMSNHKGKGKETKPAGNGVGLGGYGSDVVSDSEEDEDDEEEEPVTVTVKRGIVPNTKADAQPTVQDLLAARGIVLGGSSPSSAPAAVVKKPGFNLAAGGVKRKDLASSLGIKFAKKKKV